jgi:hypothetical protein
MHKEAKMNHQKLPSKYELKPYDVYRPAFQRHYQVYYAKSGHSFEEFDAAYRYGYQLAADPNNLSRYWDEVEEAVTSGWKDQGGSAEEIFKDAIRHVWAELKQYLECEDDDEQYAFFEPRFKRHFADYYAKKDVEYDTYEPVYRYGYLLAMDPQFDFHDWFEIEPQLKEKWAEISTILWDKDLSLTLRASVESVRRNIRLLDYGEFETTFRRHYYTSYSRPDGKHYEWYEPAYRYGYDLAMDKRYRRQDWYAVEIPVQNRWLERDYCGWADIREAVQRAWHEVKTVFGIQEVYDPTFSSLRRRYDERFQEMGYPGDNLYEAGFRYGYFLAADERYRAKEWSEVLPQVRQHLEDNPVLGSWDSFRLAVQDGWNEVKKILGES